MYIIIINDAEYFIESNNKYNCLLTNFIKYVIMDKSDESSTNKFSILFKSNNKNDFYFSLTKREYIIELLKEIQKIN